MDNFSPQVDTSTQTKDETNFPRWLSGVLTNIKRELQIRNRVLGYVTAVAGLAANTNEQTLASFTVPAGNFVTVGSSIRLVAFGTLNGNANSKTIKFKIGTTVVFTSPSLTSGTSWKIEIIIGCLAYNSQTVNIEFFNTPSNTTISETFDFKNTSNIISITGQSAVGTLNDIVLTYAEASYSGNL